MGAGECHYVASWRAEMKPDTSSAPTPKPIMARPDMAKGRVLLKTIRSLAMNHHRMLTIHLRFQVQKRRRSD